MLLYHNNNVRVTTTDDGADIGGTGSLKLPVGTTAQRNSSPASGDIRFNSTLGSFEGYSGAGWGELGGGGIGIGSTAVNPASGLVTNRIGVGFTDINVVGTGISVTGYGSTIVLDFNDFKPGSFNRSIHNYTATAGQTTFAGLSYDNSERQIAVYLNGARLSEATYTATSGTTVVLDVGASVGDEVEIINININSDVDRNVNTYTATAGQTTFTGLSYNSATELDVYLNGIRLATGDYTATSGSTVVLAVGASVNDIVDIVSTGDGVSFRSTADASGDKFTLTNVGIGQDTTPDKLNVTGNVNIVGVLTATTLHGDGSNLTNTGSTLSQPSSGTQRLVTTSLTSGTMTSSGTGSELAFDYSNNLLEFSDTTKASFGTDNDLQIWHDSGYNFIDAATGNAGFFIRGRNNTTLQQPQLKIRNDGNTEDIAKFIENGAVELYYDNTKRFETTSSGISVTGNVVASGHVMLDDNLMIRLGTGNDFELRHTGAHNYLNTQNGNIELRHTVGGANEAMLKAIPNGAVMLFHNGSTKFETTSTGASVTGNLNVSGVLTYDDVTNVDSVGIITARSGINITGGNITLGDSSGASDDRLVFGAGSDLSIYHDGTNSSIDNETAALIFRSDQYRFRDKDDGDTFANFIHDGAVELYHDNTKRFETTSSGVTVTSQLTAGTSGGQNPSASTWATNSALNLYGSYGGGIAFNDNGNNGFVMYVQSTGTQFNLKCGAVGGSTEQVIKAFQNGAVELYYDNAKKIETDTNGVTVTGNVDAGSGQFRLNDSGRIRLGASQDFEIYHNGNNSFITDAGTGNLYIRGDNTLFIQSASGEDKLKATTNGSVEIYYDNVKKFETTSSGVTVIGGLTADNVGVGDNEYIRAGNSSDIQFYHDANGSIHGTSAVSYIKCQGVHDNILDIFTASATGKIRLKSNNLAETMLVANGNGAVELYHNNVKKFETTSDGATLTGSLTVTDDITLQDDLLMGDTDTIKLGNSTDLQIFHDSSATNNVISGHTGSLNLRNYDTNSTDIILSARNDILLQTAINESAIFCDANAGVHLYFNGTQKLVTDTSGVTVSGNVVCNSSSNQVYLQASDGSIELTRSSGGAYIDFKNSTSEDYDIRINEESGALRITSDFRLYDHKALELGTGSDLKIYHNACLLYTSPSPRDS